MSTVRVAVEGRRLRLWRRNAEGTWWRRDNPPLRRLLAKATGALVERHLLPGPLYGLHRWALRRQGPVRARYVVG